MIFRWIVLTAIGAALVAPSGARAAGPAARLTKAEADSITAAILKDRADTEAWLKSASSSYLATIGRVDFEDRASLVVGSAADADVRIDDAAVSARHLRVTVAGDSFDVAAIDPDAVFTVAGEAVRSARVGPSAIGLGRYTLRLSHQRYPAVIVFDPGSPRFREYKGIEYYPVDLSYRCVAPFIANPKPDTTVILSTRGNLRKAIVAGWFAVTLGGKSFRLEASRLLEPGVGEDDVSLFFKDATTGKDTYSVGRYVNPERISDDVYVIDFNMAYNPACAYSLHYNCPIPPKANELPIPIEAGEKDGHYLAH